MQRKHGESPEGVGGMTSNPWNYGVIRVGTLTQKCLALEGGGGGWVYVFSGSVH